MLVSFVAAIPTPDDSSEEQYYGKSNNYKNHDDSSEEQYYGRSNNNKNRDDSSEEQFYRPGNSFQPYNNYRPNKRPSFQPYRPTNNYYRPGHFNNFDNDNDFDNDDDFFRGK